MRIHNLQQVLIPPRYSLVHRAFSFESPGKVVDLDTGQAVGFLISQSEYAEFLHKNKFLSWYRVSYKFSATKIGALAVMLRLSMKKMREKNRTMAIHQSSVVAFCWKRIDMHSGAEKGGWRSQQMASNFEIWPHICDPPSTRPKKRQRILSVRVGSQLNVVHALCIL